MKLTRLGADGPTVSQFGIGGMSFAGIYGNAKEADSCAVLDACHAAGVTHIDTSNVYGNGRSEEIIGTWFNKTGNRDKVVLASKIAGAGPYTAPIRSNGFAKEAIIEAVDGSLKRLQTDYIDLYQLHWPERGVNCFGVRDYPYATSREEAENHYEILETLDQLVKSGKIRHVGLSNETPWGTMKYLQTAEENNFPRMSTIQNSYSLIHRGYEVGMSEVSMRENIGLLAYSPLAQGVLSGKYLDGKQPEGARGTLFPQFIARYKGDGATAAVREYLKIAEKHGMTLSELSLAFINQLPFVTSNIIGATKMDQLKENIGSINFDLSEEVLGEIEAVHAAIPNPAP